MVYLELYGSKPILIRMKRGEISREQAALEAVAEIADPDSPGLIDDPASRLRVVRVIADEAVAAQADPEPDDAEMAERVRRRAQETERELERAGAPACWACGRRASFICTREGCPRNPVPGAPG